MVLAGWSELFDIIVHRTAARKIALRYGIANELFVPLIPAASHARSRAVLNGPLNNTISFAGGLRYPFLRLAAILVNPKIAGSAVGR